MNRTPSKAALVDTFTGRAAAAKSAVEAWSTRLIESPAYALTWSEKAFTAAGEHEVFSQLLGMSAHALDKPEITDEQLVDALLKTVNERIRHGAMYPARSTSVQSNLVEQAKLTAYAEAANLLEGRWM